MIESPKFPKGNQGKIMRKKSSPFASPLACLKKSRNRFRSQPLSSLRVITIGLAWLAAIFILGCQGANNSASAERKPPLKLSSLQPTVPFEGRIVFHSDFDGDYELYLLTKKGIKKLTDNTWDDVCGKWSPDGQKIAFAANPSGKFEIFTMRVDGSQITQITHELQNPIGHPGHAWTPDGQSIVYTVLRKRGFIRRFWMEIIDLKTQRSRRFIPEFKSSHGIPDLSPTAPLLAFTGKRRRGWDAALFNLKTRESRFLTEGGQSCRPHFSHDGGKLAYVSAEADGKADIWLMNPDGTNKQRLTKLDKTYEYFPAWSPDNKFIVFSSVDHYGDDLSGQWALYVVEVQTGRVSLLLDTPGADLFPHWAK